MTDLLPLLVAMSTWLAPMPAHAQGLIVNYGSDWLVRVQAEYRGYDLRPYRGGLSGMSPSDLGRIAWVKLDNDNWYGPLLVVDVGARHDYYDLIYRKHEVAEVGTSIRLLLGFEYSRWGEIAVSPCPPPPGSIAVRYRPPLKWDSSGGLLWREWPEQELPIRCDGWDSHTLYQGNMQ